LDRLGLTVPVVIDRDGQVAKEYLADTLPQTVIVDQQGRVRWVLSGGSTKDLAEIKQVIQQLLAESS
jgi:predicted transcriptional regulator